MIADPPVREIAPSGAWRGVDVRELWEFRDLLRTLVWRDLKVRYRQTLLGAFWVLLQPLVTTGLFTLIFNRVARIGAPGGVPYDVFVLAGLLPWSFFSAAATSSGGSLLSSANLISKVYFPRLLPLVAAVLVTLVDFAVSGLLLAGLMILRSVTPTPALVVVPLMVALGATLALGVGVWLAALNVEYRDVKVAIPFVFQIGLFATPVVYPLEALPERMRPWASLNPMVGVVDGFRSAVLGLPLPWPAIGFSLVAAMLVLATGVLFFRRIERVLVDVI